MNVRVCQLKFISTTTYWRYFHRKGDLAAVRPTFSLTDIFQCCILGDVWLSIFVLAAQNTYTKPGRRNDWFWHSRNQASDLLENKFYQDLSRNEDRILPLTKPLTLFTLSLLMESFVQPIWVVIPGRCWLVLRAPWNKTAIEKGSMPFVAKILPTQFFTAERESGSLQVTETGAAPATQK